MNKAIEIENLEVKFNGQKVLNNINLKIRIGELSAVIGPNGSGKTTLLKAILGLLPYVGKIKILDQPVKKVLNQIGYVSQHFFFDKTFPLTVKEFLEISSLGRTDLIKALREVEMVYCKNQLLGELSGGQLQRVLIARALLNNPKILLLDEATAGIDMEGEKSFYEIIQHLNKNHQTTIVIVSHEINMVYKYASQIICLNRSLVCEGPPQETITQEILQKLYSKEVSFREHRH